MGLDQEMVLMEVDLMRDEINKHEHIRSAG